MDTSNSTIGGSHERRAAISVVDDDQSILDSTRQLLRSAGYSVSTFASAKDFLNSCSVQSSECLVLDVKMPEIDGLELQRQLIVSGARVPIIFISAHDDPRIRGRAIRAGALNFLKKPFDAGVLLATIEKALVPCDAGSGAHILHFGSNDRYRAMVLRSAGYLVEECSSPDQLLRFAESGTHTDLICVSEEFESLPIEALAIARGKCDALVVLFRGTSRTYSFKFDLEIENLTPPAVWLSDIRRILAAPMELHSMRNH